MPTFPMAGAIFKAAAVLEQGVVRPSRTNTVTELSWWLQESACNVGDLGLVPGLGRSPGEGNGYSLQYFGLENSTDCTVHGVTKSRTGLSNFHSLYFWEESENISVLQYSESRVKWCSYLILKLPHKHTQFSSATQLCPTLCDPMDGNTWTGIPSIINFRSLLTLMSIRDGGAEWGAVYGVTLSRTRLKRLSSGSSMF
ncbi:hypothetical protein MG293_000779 [Ovis ammon polii]|uniref:Uncharacterized protein n=1 Tax=Ovis ammon polii TaxID=230172 RepID=A0AAD4UQK1_OVIAM|nr:hypothetical protein MG293_000779 [Ovis ammon polii]